jgi:hypothetical protein
MNVLLFSLKMFSQNGIFHIMRGSMGGGAHARAPPYVCKKSLKFTMKFFNLQKSLKLTVNFNGG